MTEFIEGENEEKVFSLSHKVSQRPPHSHIRRDLEYNTCSLPGSVPLTLWLRSQSP